MKETEKAYIVPGRRKGFMYVFRPGRIAPVYVPAGAKALTEPAVEGMTVIDMPGQCWENMMMNRRLWQRGKLDLAHIQSNGGQRRKNGTARNGKGEKAS
jgi:hypothetical protein